MHISFVYERVNMYTIIFIVIIVSADALAQSQTCPKIKPVPKLDLKDISGLWYEVARYSENSIEEKANESNVTCIMDNGIIQYKFSIKANGKVNTLHGTLRLAPEAEGRGILLYTIDTEAGTHMPDLRLNVLSIDPKKYLILYNCKYDEKIKKPVEIAWISARDPHVHKDIEDAINAFVNTEHMINLDKLVWERPSDHLVV